MPVNSRETDAMNSMNKIIDHTLLKADANEAHIEKLCEEACNYRFHSVCVGQTRVGLASRLLKDTKVKVCTVAGFPLGFSLPSIKAYEASKAVESGADEIDMVMNIGALKDGNLKLVGDDIRAVVNSAGNETVIKVILECCLLNRQEMITACRICMSEGAGFVKTSTGLSAYGARVEDVRLLRETVGDKMGVKAAGGIRDYRTAAAMVRAGADRIGTSSSVLIMQGV